MATKSRDRLLLWMGLLLGTALLLPNHYSPWLSIHQELGVALAFGPALVWSVLHVRRIPALAIAAALLSIVPLLQMAVGQLFFASDGWMAFLYVMGFALAVYAGARCTERGGPSATAALYPQTWPLTGLLLAAVLSVGIQLYQWLLLGNGGIYVAELPPHSRPFGNLAQPNQLATLLLMGVAGILFLWEIRKLRISVALAAALVLAFGLVMTGSRSVLLTLIWLVPVYGLMRRRCNLRTSPSAVATVIGFYLLCSFGWASINAVLMLDIDPNAAVERIAELGIRKVLWASMLDAIGRAPWRGYGWGQIGVAQTATALDHPATYSFFDSSHNLLIDLALWNGLPVAAAVIFVLVLWFGWQVYQCRDPLSFALLIAIGVVLSHAMVEYPLNYAYFLLPTGFWMGVLTAAHPCPLDCSVLPRLRPLLRAMAVAITAGVLVLFITVVVEYFPYEADWRLMQFQQRRIGNLEHSEPPPAIILTGLREFMKFSRAEAKPGLSAQDMEQMRRTSERYAYASSMFKYALAQALNHQGPGAQLTLRRLCKMQTAAACKSAGREWRELTKNQYPQLTVTPFPPDETQKHGS